MGEKKKIIQVGVGGFGRSWVDILLNSPEWEAVAFVDINKDALDRIVEECGIEKNKCFLSLDECLEKVKADALLNITPPSSHKEITVKSLKKGLHVLVEKPLSDNLEDAEEMVSISEKYGLKIMVSQNYRYRKIPRSIRSFIEKGKLGKIGYFSVFFQKGPRFTGFRKEMDYPLLKDMAIHHFDLARYIIGKEPKKVYAESWNPSWSWFKGDACLIAIFEFEDGIRFNYFGSWVSTGRETTWDGDWEIFGEEGSILWRAEKVEFIKGEERENIEIIDLERQDRYLSLLEFYKSIVEKRRPETDGRDNLKSLKMVFYALESIKSKKVVEINGT